MRPVTVLSKLVTQITPTKEQKHSNTAKDTKENYNRAHERHNAQSKKGTKQPSRNPSLKVITHIPASPSPSIQHTQRHIHPLELVTIYIQ